jgi:5-oxoprolinase (ATP-hydrolysing) subunit C
MSKLVISSIGPASSVQDGGRPGSQRYGLTPGGAVDRLALASANVLVGNAPFAAAIEIGPLGACFTAQEGAVRVALVGALRHADIAKRPVAFDSSMTLADGESLTLGFARGGSFSYLAIEGGIQGEPMFGSLSVNARAGLGSPYPRPLQEGDELQTVAASGAASSFLRSRIRRSGSCWVRRMMNSTTMPKACFWTASGGYRRPAIGWATDWKAPSSSICTAITSSPTAP